MSEVNPTSEDAKASQAASNANHSNSGIDSGVIKTKIQSSWGERIITTAILSVIPYMGITNSELIQKITPIISGIMIIIISLALIYFKDLNQEFKKKKEKELSRLEFENAKKALEEILESKHLDDATRDINSGQINELYIKWGAEAVSGFNNRKNPEIYSHIGDTLTEMENAINKKR
jgi:beta-lactamase regulating signal transducer with metallopeptidase domain